MASEIILTNEATPSTPSTGTTKVFVNSSKQFSIVDDAGTVTVMGSGATLSKFTNSLGADVSLNNTANFFDGPSVAQGTSGIWFASGNVTMQDTGGSATFYAKLWDGTTVISSTVVTVTTGSTLICVSLSGYISSPAGNIRISVKDASRTTGVMAYNISGTTKDCTLSVFKIG